jgi:uncharacterized protein YecE (DUF72 family)
MRETKSSSRSTARARGRVKRVGDLRIGISGWNYKPWRGVFYPPKHPQKRELEFASRAFNSIEINGTFYSLQRPESFQKWFEESPANFLFAVKGGRFITHMKKLRDVEVPLANFFASGLLRLGKKLGPILWQFPPNFGWNEARFREFFAILPRDTEAAAELARRHDQKLKGRAWLETDERRVVRHAVEIRHPTFLVPAFFDLLREENIAFVLADTARRFPYAEELTSDFVYCRLHGDEQLYVSGYSDSALDWWAERMRRWRSGRDLFVYFDNDAKVHAPFDAQRLHARLTP